MLEHIPFDEAVEAVKHIAKTVKPNGKLMVVGPCMDKAIATGQPETLLDAIRHHPDKPAHPWSHAWTPTEPLTVEVIEKAGFKAQVVSIESVVRPEWPNPSIALWQTAILFTN